MPPESSLPASSTPSFDEARAMIDESGPEGITTPHHRLLAGIVDFLTEGDIKLPVEVHRPTRQPEHATAGIIDVDWRLVVDLLSEHHSDAIQDYRPLPTDVVVISIERFDPAVIDSDEQDYWALTIGSISKAHLVFTKYAVTGNSADSQGEVISNGNPAKDEDTLKSPLTSEQVGSLKNLIAYLISE